MKLGSIVGIVFSCLLIISGIVLCVVGNVKAEEAGQLLFTQRSEDGTYYSEKISEGTHRLTINFENADITVIGGAEKSNIEFKNFNPNLYTVSVTPNIFSFEEIPSLTSIVNVIGNDLNFKGLRYLLDFNNYDFDDLQKSIIITLSDDSDLKDIDIVGKKGNVRLKNISLNGDISIKLEDGNVSADSLKTSSTFEVSGGELACDIRNLKASTLRYNAVNTVFKADGCSVTSTEINASRGSVEYKTEDVLSDAYIDIDSQTGEMTVNGEIFSEQIFSSPEEYEKSLKVITEEASINLSYGEIQIPESSEEVTE